MFAVCWSGAAMAHAVLLVNTRMNEPCAPACLLPLHRLRASGGRPCYALV